jgi:hypothetical protein
MRAGVESTSHHADNLKGKISMNALYTHLCLYISGAYDKAHARLDAKRESGMETIEILLWAVGILLIVGVVYAGLNTFVGGLLPKLTLPF